MDKIKFIDIFYPIAKIAGDKFGLNPVVILAQAAHESAWGDSYGARNRKNFFGIIASGSKNEFWDGTFSTSTASGLKFRIYKSVLDGFSDFARLISSKASYKPAYNVNSDSTAYAKAIAYSPYISEANGDNRPVYEKAVKDNSEFINKILGPTLLKEAGKKKSP